MSRSPLPQREPPTRKPPTRAALINWFAAMGAGGFAFGLLGHARPLGSHVLAEPIVLFFLVVGLGLLVLRVVLARPVPEVLPERMLLFGILFGLALFVAGNFVTIHLLAG
jgi:hypothetical protein